MRYNSIARIWPWRLHTFGGASSEDRTRPITVWRAAVFITRRLTAERSRSQTNLGYWFLHACTGRASWTISFSPYTDFRFQYRAGKKPSQNAGSWSGTAPRCFEDFHEVSPGTGAVERRKGFGSPPWTHFELLRPKTRPLEPFQVLTEQRRAGKTGALILTGCPAEMPLELREHGLPEQVPLFNCAEGQTVAGN